MQELHELDDLYSDGEKREGIILKWIEVGTEPSSIKSIDITDIDSTFELLIYKLITCVYFVCDDEATLRIKCFNKNYEIELRGASTPIQQDLLYCWEIIQSAVLELTNNHPTAIKEFESLKEDIINRVMVFEE